MGFVFKTLAATAIMSALAVSAWPAAAEDVTLGYVAASLEYPYNVAVADGFKEAAQQLGAKAIVLDPRGSVEKQGNAIDDLIAQGVDGIGALPLDGVVAQTWVDKLADHNIPFVSAATQIGDPQKVAWDNVYPKLTALVGMDNVKAGELSGELAATLLPKDRTAKIGIIEGAPGYPQVWQRSQGFKQGLDKAGIKYEVVASQPTDWTPEKGEAVCQNILASNPDVDLFFSQADDMAIGCSRAIHAAGSKARLVATGGGSHLGIDAIRSGEIDGSVCDRPKEEGRLVAKALYEAVTKKNTRMGQLITYDTPAITKETLSRCPAEW